MYSETYLKNTKHCANSHSYHEDEEKHPVQTWVELRIEYFVRSISPNPPMKEPRMANDESTRSRFRMVGINLWYDS
jgi:hypothetical protein